MRSPLRVWLIAASAAPTVSCPVARAGQVTSSAALGSTAAIDTTRVGRVLIATRTRGIVTIDGNATRSEWAGSMPVGGFTQREPAEGAAKTDAVWSPR